MGEQIESENFGGLSLERSSLFQIVSAIEGPIALMMEAHDGLSARIVERVGFGSVWASGFSIATSLGLRDSNEAPWLQVLDAVENIRRSTKLPILLDADTGFGDEATIRNMATRVCKLGIDGICIEDKKFPKRNSFVGGNQELASIGEHCARLYAIQEARSGDQLVLIARTESLIVGAGMDDAISRADAYVRAGADAIFIHSKAPNPSEIIEFGRRWQKRSPLIIAPTSFPSVKQEELAGLGISVVIAANQMIRAAMGAMQTVAMQILQSRSLNVDVPPMTAIFDLLDYPALREL